MSNPHFTAQFTRHTGTLRGEISGELDLAAAPKLTAALDAALNTPDIHHTGGVVLDLTAVDFIDSSGLRALLQARNTCTTRHLPFALTVTEGPVTRLLNLAGIQDWFTYQPADPATNPTPPRRNRNDPREPPAPLTPTSRRSGTRGGRGAGRGGRPAGTPDEQPCPGAQA